VREGPILQTESAAAADSFLAESALSNSVSRKDLQNHLGFRILIKFFFFSFFLKRKSWQHFWFPSLAVNKGTLTLFRHKNSPNCFGIRIAFKFHYFKGHFISKQIISLSQKKKKIN